MHTHCCRKVVQQHPIIHTHAPLYTVHTHTHTRYSATFTECFIADIHHYLLYVCIGAYSPNMDPRCRGRKSLLAPAIQRFCCLFRISTSHGLVRILYTSAPLPLSLSLSHALFMVDSLTNATQLRHLCAYCNMYHSNTMYGGPPYYIVCTVVHVPLVLLGVVSTENSLEKMFSFLPQSPIVYPILTSCATRISTHTHTHTNTDTHRLRKFKIIVLYRCTYTNLASPVTQHTYTIHTTRGQLWVCGDVPNVTVHAVIH